MFVIEKTSNVNMSQTLNKIYFTIYSARGRERTINCFQQPCQPQLELHSSQVPDSRVRGELMTRV